MSPTDRGPSASVRYRKSTINIEEPFRLSFKEIAAQEGSSVSALVSRIDAERQHANLSSAVRLYILDHYRQLAELGLTVKQKPK